MLISNKIHYFRNFSLQKYLFILKTENDLCYFFGAIPKNMVNHCVDYIHFYNFASKSY